MFTYIILTIISPLFHIVSSSDYPYIINANGQTCSDAPSSPTQAEDCTVFHSSEIACCFAEIEVDEVNKVKKCVGVNKDYRFALNHLRGINIAGYTNVNANFTCGQKDRLCGTNSPSYFLQCREHSSDAKSCCMLTDGNGDTNCILTQDKYEEETSFTLFETNDILCGSLFVEVKIMIIVVFVVGLLM